MTTAFAERTLREVAQPAPNRPDARNRLSRISYRRATPEKWERTVTRMMSLKHVSLTPADARAIVKYLSDHNGLAPEEARPAAFDVERRLVDYTYPGDKDTAALCSGCHSLGRVIAERRAPEEWGLLIAMHGACYTTDQLCGRERDGNAGADPREAAGRDAGGTAADRAGGGDETGAGVTRDRAGAA